MQTYTNKFNLAPEIVSAIIRDRYNPDNEDLGDYSATTLVAPIQQTILKRRYPDNLKVEDVVDRFWSFMGSVAHKVLEEHADDNAIVENRLIVSLLGKRLSGQTDHYKNRQITDYKFTKAYKIQKGDYSDWEKQLNIYAYIYSMNGYIIDRLLVYAFIMDWKKYEAYKKGYPECVVVKIPLRLWSINEQEEYIKLRLAQLIQFDGCSDDELPECTDKEMWRDVKDFAVFKKNGKRALKVFDNEQEAQVFCTERKDVIMVKRMTKRTRCLEHCPVSHICHQHRRLSKEEGVSIEQQFETERPIF